MRQEQPKTARLRHSDPTKGGQKPKISSTIPPKRRSCYISAELRVTWEMSSNMARESNQKVERRVRQMAKAAKKNARLAAKKEKAAKGSTQKWKPKKE